MVVLRRGENVPLFRYTRGGYWSAYLESNMMEGGINWLNAF